MHETHEHLQTLTEIRSLMERSSKFLSLSGLSGISAGLIALIGAGAAYMRLKTDWTTLLSYDRSQLIDPDTRQDLLRFLLTDGILVLVLALAAGVFFTMQKARRQGQTVWNSASKRLLTALFIPLTAGGVFCLGMIYHGQIWLVFPATLIFYGLALLNASRYTVRDLHYLGIFETGLGLLSVFWTGYNLFTWAIGFGVLHILYGTIMYLKYDLNERTARTV